MKLTPMNKCNWVEYDCQHCNGTGLRWPGTTVTSVQHAACKHCNGQGKHLSCRSCQQYAGNSEQAKAMREACKTKPSFTGIIDIPTGTKHLVDMPVDAEQDEVFKLDLQRMLDELKGNTDVEEGTGEAGLDPGGEQREAGGEDPFAD